MAELEARLESLKAVLPEQKDVGDLLRRIQTLATQSNLAIRGFKPAPTRHQADARGVADRAASSRARTTTSAIFFDRVSKFSRIINISNIDIKAKDARSPTRR